MSDIEHSIETQFDSADIGQWYEHGACKGLSPEIMFPTDDDGVEAAKGVCAGCHVTSLCLEYAIEHRERDGVWGGTSARDRRRIIRQRRRAL